MCDVCKIAQDQPVMHELAVNWGPISMGVSAVEGEMTLKEFATHLKDIASSMADAAQAKFDQWEKNPSEGLWRERDELWREYAVLRAWSQMFEAASVFQHEGATSTLFPQPMEWDIAMISAALDRK
jgi:hypothetical protein